MSVLFSLIKYDKCKHKYKVLKDEVSKYQENKNNTDTPMTTTTVSVKNPIRNDPQKHIHKHTLTQQYSLGDNKASKKFAVVPSQLCLKNSIAIE